MKAIIIAAMVLLVSSSASAVTHTFTGAAGNDEMFLGRLQTLSAGVWTTQPGVADGVNGVITSSLRRG